jgi:effector-binding domain-containing protein
VFCSVVQYFYGIKKINAMLTEPKVEYREEQPYAAIHKKVAMQQIPTELPPLIFEVLKWLEKNKLEEAGPAFFRYLSMDRGTMDVEVGVPLKQKPQGDGKVIGGSFPAGKYLTARHTGPYTELPKSHMSMDNYAKQHGLNQGTIKGENGETWGTRAEFYITHPDEEKDQSKWITDLALYLADR